MRAWSKSLIWLAVLLSPLQALQGTHILCQFVGCRHGNLVSFRIDQPDHASRCQCHRKTTNAALTDDDQQAYTAPLFECIGQSRPCHDCPSRCFCRRPAQPQCLLASPVQLKIVDGLAVAVIAQVDAKCNALLHVCAESHRETSVPISAQQFCASLCRFTI